ncbi:uncharacterized protein [Oscarella lobularis]|uniref:uncharacterized protein n=1 Tax=Oscarella lobularis TaxID=121494 RepID=UPI0033136B06
MDLEEAKTRIWELIETKRQDVDAMTVLSRKRGLLEERNQQLEASLAEMQEQIKRLECLDEERRSLAGQFNQASKSLGSSGSSIEVEQSFESADEWVRIMNQLKSENQLLARDKSDIEEHSKERQQRTSPTVRDVSSPLLVPVFSSSPLRPSMDDSDDDVDDDEFLCPVSSLTSSFEQFALIASQAEVLSRQRAEKAMQLISELSVLDPSRRLETEAVKMEFEEERESLRQKLGRLIESKKRTMKRKQQLETTVQKLKQEKEKLVKRLRAKELQLSADINDPVTNGKSFSNWESLINEDSFGVETEKGLLAEKIPVIKEESCSTESLLCTLLCILAVVVFSATFAFSQF